MSDLTPSMTAALAAIQAGHRDVVAIRDEAQLSPRSAPGVLKGLVKRGLILHLESGEYVTPEQAEAATGPFAHFDDALTAAAALREAGAPLVLAPAGKVAKMIRVTLDLRISTDGRWVVAKMGEGEKTWSLYSADDTGATLVGEYPTCTAAFAPANLTD